MKRLLVVALLVVACGGARSNPTDPPEPATPDPGYITRTGYGVDWPFSVPAGKLDCYDGAAAGGGGRILVTFYVEDRGIEYGLNGSALDFGFPDLDATILPDYPDKTGILDLIERGLALC
jgi:hypothetical protein